MIFDIEGTDSHERGESRIKFEQTTSLFALALTDVLMINLWAQDIGRHHASNYGLLKTIFEINLKLFNQSSQKKICFVLRDFMDKGDNREKVSERLTSDLKMIWDEIYKSDDHANARMEDFFHVEYNFMPHKEYMPEAFEEKCAVLKERFFVGHDDTLFPSVDSRNVPIEALNQFLEQIWTAIVEEKDINLPGEKKVLA